MMMIPEAWQNDAVMPDSKRAFYQYHSCLMEPWDGPASIAFTDGRQIGAVLDRNGLRPSRYLVTKGGLVVMASETGVLDIPPDQIELKERLHPGRMFLVDTAQGRIVKDAEIKESMAARKPYRQWLKDNLVNLNELPEPQSAPAADGVGQFDPLAQQQAFGYTIEELKMILAPMAANGQEPVGSMGTDTPLAVLSDMAPLLFNYFKQLFAQVTNPPVDSIREEMVMSAETTIGSEQNLFEETPEHCRQLRLASPILTNAQLEKLKRLAQPGLRSITLPALFKATDGEAGMRAALDDLCRRASEAIAGGYTIIVLSDRGVNDGHAPIPSLLATGAVHHHLIREGTRTRVGLVVESGEPREVMHFCLLMGYGADAINPYLAYATMIGMIRDGELRDVSEDDAVEHFIKAVDQESGQGRFQDGDLDDPELSRRANFRGDRAHPRAHRPLLHLDRIAGPGRGTGRDRARDPAASFPRIRCGPVAQRRARRGRPVSMAPARRVPHVQSEYYRQAPALGAHGQLPGLQGVYASAQRSGPPSRHAARSDEVQAGPFAGADRGGRAGRRNREAFQDRRDVIRLDQQGSARKPGDRDEPDRRQEQHRRGWRGPRPLQARSQRRLAPQRDQAGRLGALRRDQPLPGQRRRAANQDGAGRETGRGRPAPGHKVNDFIAKIRYAVPGVGLISPPPHHDIYSIEDLAQLIFDLKNANDRARVSVKLVAEVGVGTIAAGVSKAKADVVLISGYDGGTGASPLTSIKHAGIPWELGLAETQQILVMNDLRGRIRVETDGQLKTGRDVTIAALLGADEFGFASAALVASGCIMMRVCHLNTCPVGIATQDPELRKKFEGKPEHVVNLMMFIAEEVREYMAQLGFRSMDEMIGHVECLEPNEAITHWKAKGIDLSNILYRPDAPPEVAIHNVETQDHGLGQALDRQLIEQCRQALEHRKPVELKVAIRNSNRAAGTMLSAEVSRRWEGEGLPPYTIRIHFKGSAGQSFGAWLAPGVAFYLEGDANDYIGKGLSGGFIAVRPPREATFKAEDNILIGNVALYGATGGEAFFRGMAGERFAVRNSGAVAVVEGVGDHGCEYMTRGKVVVLGRTGRNFAAGMSGGIAYVLDEEGGFASRCNLNMVELLALKDADELNQHPRAHHAPSPVHRKRSGAPRARSMGRVRRQIRQGPADRVSQGARTAASEHRFRHRAPRRCVVHVVND